MFRRKEESANDFSADTSANPVTNGASHAHESASPVMAAAPAAQAAPAHNSYAPTAHTPRPVGEPTRLPPVSGYRPTPIAEFSRNQTARTSEPARAPVATAAPQATSSFASASAEKSISPKPNRRVLTVGNDILLKGEIATCDRLVIEGRVEAKLSDVHTVEIAEVGSFKGTAEVEDAEISGVFEGDLVVRNRLVIYATGEVRGNIGYGEIEIERGGKLTGQIKTVAAGAQAGKVKSLDLPEVKARATKESVAA